MVTILRHRARENGLEVASDGFVKLSDLLACQPIKRYNPTLEDVKTIVATCPKQRFGFKEQSGIYLIRANQGHTMTVVKTADLLDEIIDYQKYPTCVHGTYWKAWKRIKKRGLFKMDRNHIHFAPGEKISGTSAVISGMRKNAQLLIYIDLQKAMADGLQFYVSANEVILTEGKNGWVHKKYFEKVKSVDGKAVDFRGGDYHSETNVSHHFFVSPFRGDDDELPSTSRHLETFDSSDDPFVLKLGRQLSRLGLDKFVSITRKAEDSKVITFSGELPGKKRMQKYEVFLENVKNEKGVEFEDSVKLRNPSGRRRKHNKKERK